MYFVLLGLFVADCAYQALHGWLEMRRLDVDAINEQMRLKKYRSGLLMQGIDLLVIGAVLLFRLFSVAELGVRLPRLSSNATPLWLGWVVVAISGLMALLLVYQIVSFLVSPAYRTQVEAKLLGQTESNDLYGKMTVLLIPRSPREKHWFGWLSLFAGISEELLFRGLLFALLCAAFPAFSVWAPVIIGGVLFGTCHCYQGLTGFIKTAALGMFFGLLYACTGSVLPGMLLHFFMDVSSAFLLEPEAAAVTDAATQKDEK